MGDKDELVELCKIAQHLGGPQNLSAVGIGRYLRLCSPELVLMLVSEVEKLATERDDLRAEEATDLPPETGHAIPQWLRERFSAVEDEAMQMGGCAVFTQMRTSVQAYFEMLRSLERGKAGKQLFIIEQQRNLIASLREDLQQAIAIDCNDDVIDACAEVERTGTPGSVIRAMNDELVDLRKDAERFRFIAQDADSGMRRIYGDDWIAVVDAGGVQS